MTLLEPGLFSAPRRGEHGTACEAQAVPAKSQVAVAGASVEATWMLTPLPVSCPQMYQAPAASVPASHTPALKRM